MKTVHPASQVLLRAIMFIYIKDDDHYLSNIYRDLYIKRDMSFSIPFSIKNGAGQLRVVRNGETILNEKVTK